MFLIEELGMATQSVQKALLRIVFERYVGNHPVSPHVSTVAITNERRDRTGVQGLLTTLTSRFSTVVHIEPSAKDWIEWASVNGVPVELLAFIQLQPKWIEDRPTMSIDMENFPCPRTITQLGKWVSLGIQSDEVWTGCVGNDMATAFRAFYDSFVQIGSLMHDVIANPDNATIPDAIDQRFMIAAHCTNIINPSNVGNVLKYANRLDDDYKAFIAHIGSMKNAEVKETRDFVEFATRNQNILY